MMIIMIIKVGLTVFVLTLSLGANAGASMNPAVLPSQFSSYLPNLSVTKSTISILVSMTQAAKLRMILNQVDFMPIAIWCDKIHSFLSLSIVRTQSKKRISGWLHAESTGRSLENVKISIHRNRCTPQMLKFKDLDFQFPIILIKCNISLFHDFTCAGHFWLVPFLIPYLGAVIGVIVYQVNHHSYLSQNLF